MRLPIACAGRGITTLLSCFGGWDAERWETSGPIRMLGNLDQAKLEVPAKDESVLAHLDRMSRELTAYLEISSAW